MNCSARADITPKLEMYLHYNDNVSLNTSGLEKESIITELKPGLFIEHDGRRFDALINYDVQFLHFSGDVDDDKTYQQLFADTTTMFVPELFYLDARATYSQQFIDPLGTISLDNLSLTDNIADVSTYTISPYVRQRYGVTATGDYRIGYENLTYHGTETISQSDTQIQTASATIESGPRFDDLGWRLFYSYENVKPENELDTTFQRSIFSVNYRVRPNFSLIGEIGYEDNRYEHVDTSEIPSGEYWAAGFGWNPSIRTSMEVKAGERFFGNTGSFLFTHRTRRTIWRIEYLEDITTTAQLQVSSQNQDPTQPQDPSMALNPILSQTVEVVFLERFALTFTGTTAKTETSFTMYKDVRTYQEDGGEEEVLGAGLDWRWRIFTRTSVVLDAQWYRQDYRGSERADKTTQSELSLERQIQRTLTGVIAYGWLDRNSNEEEFQYDRNLVSIGVRAEF
ncbi:MAG: TIGR03016 family PEP-CTERM system-associated outer membrane protein [Gammaproteobacteria bacterium]|nr:TIGR03016 family PEP-CTERM system-associated outer membrane protein [Gammaproteobacteria bacterium]